MRMKRLELLRRETLEPKSSASTNSATSAKFALKIILERLGTKVNKFSQINLLQFTKLPLTV